MTGVLGCLVTGTAVIACDNISICICHITHKLCDIMYQSGDITADDSITHSIFCLVAMFNIAMYERGMYQSVDITADDRGVARHWLTLVEVVVALALVVTSQHPF